ncbi:hypothetical protein [Bifidobacterium sp. ESL0764]|uniref:hypothetical protein n=1 Tax=Bifidobacterium sp. ESL0764 TaxID=2983228 RepID=UPI0023F8E887|nr:hypothetical protein [Bifidobacterium sp. ESL0764]WEV65730.1 hypothetical protein OZX71_08300 [Bifidobacterium sp. ESL0764]
MRLVLVVIVAVAAILGAGSAISSATAAGGQTDVTAETDTADTRDANTRDLSWRKGTKRTAPNGADRKPVLFQMLSYNDKINTNIDEIRVDAVIRVAHGEVSTKRENNNSEIASGSWSGDTGLRFVYNFISGGTNGNGLNEDYDDGSHIVKYANTAGGKAGANQWAANQDEVYTIHKIIHSGLYDYVTISFVADVDYPDSGKGSWWQGTTKDGRTTDAAQIWVLVGRAALDSANYKINGRGDLDYYQDQYGLATNIMAGRHVQLFPSDCTDTTNGANKAGCNQPNLFMNFDAHPQWLWTANQANWGLVSDYGLGGTFYSVLQHSKGNHNTNMSGDAGTSTYAPAGHLNGTDEGVAPPNSFLINWYDNNTSSGQVKSNPCHQYKSYWYEWMELKNNSTWVPVTSLTGDGARPVTGQPPSYETANEGNGVGLGNDTFAYNENNTSKSNNLFYRPTEGKNQAGGPMQPAQNADGSIDFKKAKAEDPGDGYFKLLTWPNVEADGCAASATDDAHNPGITLDMVKNHPDVAKARFDKAWVDDTAFYKYDVSRPTVPVITGVSADDADSSDIAFADMASTDSQFALGDNKAVSLSTASKPTIKGTGTPGQEVSLYEDVPNATDNYSDGSKKNVIVKGTVDDYENMGHLVGKATVGADGKWSIQADDADDTVDSTKAAERLRRYHAYQTDLTTQINGMKMDLSSYFSPVSVVQFKMPPDPAASVDKVVVPHTVNGALEGSDPKVAISGTVYSAVGGSSMKLYAQHVDARATRAAKATKKSKAKASGSTRSAGGVKSSRSGQRGAPTAGDELQECAQTNVAKDTTDAATGKVTGTEWSCQVATSWFASKAPDAGSGCDFNFTAVTTNSEGDEVNASKTLPVDFYAPKAGLKTADHTGLSGRVTPTGPALQSAAAGAKITITWPAGTPSGAPTSATAGADGSWHVALKPGTPKGTVTVQAQEVDADGKPTNQSAVEHMTLIPAPPLAQLPFTGNRPWVIWLLALVVSVVAIGGYELMKRYRVGLAEGRPMHAVARSSKARHGTRHEAE